MTLTEVFFILIAFVVSLFVVLPIVQARSGRQFLSRNSSNHRIKDLEERKETLYSTIKDIEFDYETGKLSESDFKDLRAQYKQEAIGILKEIDQLQKRTVKPKSLFGKQETQPKISEDKVSFCWLCGTAVAENDQYCANCGNELT
jgi:hypothetical protein